LTANIDSISTEQGYLFSKPIDAAAIETR